MTSKWDVRFLQLARTVSTWSRDPSTKTGAVIVRPDKTVASLGFNGFPASMPDDDALYADREEKYSRIIHCEVNALLHARGSVEGFTLYTFPFICCDRCAVQMLGAGIVRFVFPELPETLRDRWGSVTDKARKYISEARPAGVSLTEYPLGSF